MIKTIIVDDEKPAIAKIKNILSDYPDYELCGCYTDSQTALDEAIHLRPQVAFLDIAMPGIEGTILAERLHNELGKDIHIVFITAYNEYALTAFDLWAVDYLLKPVSRARFSKTIERLNELISRPMPLLHPPSPASVPMIRLFGKLEIIGDQSTNTVWRTAKVRELFAFFIHHRNQRIYRNLLLETLWPDLPPERALSNLNTCNYYLRTMLKQTNLNISLEYRNHYYWVDTHNILIDADEFLQAVKIGSQELTEPKLSLLLTKAKLYRGLYLEDVKCTWADIDRGIYADNYVGLMLSIASCFFSHGQFSETVSAAAAALEVNRLHTAAWDTLINAYESMGDFVQSWQAKKNRDRAYSEKSDILPKS